MNFSEGFELEQVDRNFCLRYYLQGFADGFVIYQIKALFARAAEPLCNKPTVSRIILHHQNIDEFDFTARLIFAICRRWSTTGRLLPFGCWFASGTGVHKHQVAGFFIVGILHNLYPYSRVRGAYRRHHSTLLGNFTMVSQKSLTDCTTLMNWSRFTGLVT